MHQESVVRTRTPSASAPAPVPAPVPDWLNQKASAQALRAAQARQNSNRRRFVDPTTCERDYTREELEFMRAMQDYKQKSGRMFPTWSEILEVLRDLGYEKVHPTGQEPKVQGTPASAPDPKAR